MAGCKTHPALHLDNFCRVRSAFDRSMPNMAGWKTHPALHLDNFCRVRSAFDRTMPNMAGWKTHPALHLDNFCSPIWGGEKRTPPNNFSENPSEVLPPFFVFFRYNWRLLLHPITEGPLFMSTFNVGEP